jgi:hypothetical protein
MKNRSIRSVVLTTALGFVLLGVGCISGPQSGNLDQNQIRNNNQPSDDSNVVVFETGCDEQNIDRRVERVQAKINEKLEEHPNVKAHVRKVGNTHLEILVQGEVRGKEQMIDVNRTIKAFMKNKCALRVVFVPPGTLPLTNLRQDIRGFMWGACEDPMVPCPDGSCRNPPCAGESNSNANVGTNSNTNTNTNTNTNGGNRNN